MYIHPFRERARVRKDKSYRVFAVTSVTDTAQTPIYQQIKQQALILKIHTLTPGQNGLCIIGKNTFWVPSTKPKYHIVSFLFLALCDRCDSKKHKLTRDTRTRVSRAREKTHAHE